MEVRVLRGSTAAERLEALGAREEWFREAVKASELARDACSPLHAPTFPGFSAWSHRIERLRLLSRSAGWKPVNYKNMPMVESPDGQIAIVCISGDDRVGLEGPPPKTKRDRGPVTDSAVGQNAEQLSFLHLLPGLIEQRRKLDHAFTYVLLTYRSGSQVRLELSLPYLIDREGRVAEWTERNLLEPVDLEVSMALDKDQEPLQFEVEVNRKQS